MLKSLKIKNFKSYKDVFIEFSPGLNAIVGESQAGKSNILKALRWVSDNKPLSGKILNKKIDSDEVEVTLETTNSIVTLNKKIGKNNKIKNSIYTVNGINYKAFGSNPPEEVKLALNMSDLNIQKQSDRSYLITSTSGEIAKEINKITKLENSDNWIKKLTSKISLTASEIKSLEFDVKELNEKIDKFKNLERIERLIKNYEKLEENIDDHKYFKEELIYISNTLLNTIKTVSKLKDIVAYVNKNEKALNSIVVDLKDYYEIKSYLLKYKKLNKQISKLKDVLTLDIKEIEKIDNHLDDYYEVKDNLEKYKKISKQISNIKDILKLDIKEVEKLDIKIEIEKKKKLYLVKYNKNKIEINFVKKEMNRVSENYISILKKFKKCPVCESKITYSIIKSISLK